MPLIDMRPSLVLPPCALKNVIVGVAARPLLSTVTPGIAFRSDPYARVAGNDEIASAPITVPRRVFCRSTTGDAALTVTRSSTAPLCVSIVTDSLIEAAGAVAPRGSGGNRGKVASAWYVPGRRPQVRY